MTERHDPLPIAKGVAIGTIATGIFVGPIPFVYGIGMYGVCRGIEIIEKRKSNQRNNSEKK